MIAHASFYRFLILLSLVFHLFFTHFLLPAIVFCRWLPWGYYGHIPEWQTRFMVEKLKEFPDWFINLELEPESWDTIKLRDRISYDQFQKIFADQSLNGRVEYVNPSLWTKLSLQYFGRVSHQAIQYGMQKLKQHFPTAVFSTYSSEEPCFTQCFATDISFTGFLSMLL
jgi:alpha-mannosidase